VQLILIHLDDGLLKKPKHVAAVFYIIHTIHILTINMTTNQCTKQNTKSPSKDGTLVPQHLAALIIVMN
jgi:hypothetical protein